MNKRLLIDYKDIKPSCKDLEVIGIFNPSVIKFNGEVIMIARVAEKVKQKKENTHYLVPSYKENKGLMVIEVPKSKEYDYTDVRVIRNHKKNYLTSMSHFRILRSTDGINFTFNNEYIMPNNIYEEYGIEDPRITKIGKTYYITYTAVSSCGMNVALIKTNDFIKFERLGNIFHSDNKDCVIFPEKINGKYFALHRPNISQFGKLDIWTAESSNLIDWGNHKIMLKARVNYTDSSRVGAGAVPLLTERGWLVIYHSADHNNRYHLTAMVLSKDNPNKIIMKSKRPLLEPTEVYEKEGFFQNVVFTCGLLADKDFLDIYYGVCDDSIAYAKLSWKQLWENLEEV